MTTTIQVTDATKQMLDSLKEKEKATSFDQVIQDMAQERLKIPRSMFGKGKGFGWKKAYRMDFDGD